MSFKLTINTREIEKLNKKINKLSNQINQPKKEVLSLIGVRWVGMIKSNISKGVSVNGNKFPSVSYTKYRYENGKGARYSSKMFRDVNPLQDTGRLIGSIMTTDISNNSVTVGTNVPYAETHNEGIGFVKKRQFIPTNKSGKGYSKFVEVATDTLDLWIKEQIKNGKLN